MIQISNIKLKINHTDQDLQKKIMEICKIRQITKESVNISWKIVRRSLDARKKPDIYYVYTVQADFGKHNNLINKYIKQKKINNISFDIPKPYELPKPGELNLDKPPVVVGSGPCGLFAAYLLAQKGFKPIVVERGESVEDRLITVNKTFESGVLNEESNVQFGEGGAGTFSDGKLNTLTKDVNGRNTYVLKTFADFGADEDIRVNAKPHIGTDLLTTVVANMRKKIIELGGQFLFSHKFIDFDVNDGKITSVTVINLKTQEEFKINTELCILAIGHSSRDTFLKLYNEHIQMEQKNFAVGFRVAHPQSMVNSWQLGVKDSHKLGLESADYKVTNETSNNRRVYSFCMCPGGYVVNASSEKGQLCVNGMSESKRDSAYANSAIICAITPEDFIQNEVSSDHPLSGMYYQREIEKKAYELKNGKICVQRFTDFEKNIPTQNLNPEEGTTKGLTACGNLRNIFSKEIDEAIIESIHKFGYTRKGFDSDKALMYGVESRTSSPIRINRDEEFQSNIKGLFPSGEGAGYAGGITSAAVDGMKVSEYIISTYKPIY